MTKNTTGRPGGMEAMRGMHNGKRNGSLRKESPLTGKRRGWILFIGLLITMMTVYLIYSLYDLQINQYEYYSKLASQQHWKRILDKPVRGDILDTNGNIMASTTYVYTVGITPSDVRSLTASLSLDTQTIAENIASLVGLDVSDVTKALSQTDAAYVQLAKNLSKDQIDLLNKYISDNSLGGIKIDSVEKRYYSNGTLAPQVIGFAQETDGKLVGQLGVESYYNQELSGKEGYSYVEVDNFQQRSALPYSAPTTIAAQDGYNVVLNIDENIQQIAEEECAKVNDMYDVIDGVSAIVMNPYTGAVLASVSCPGFDANAPREKPFWIDSAGWDAMSNDDQMTYLMSQAWRNRAISDTYEPGSTFKAFTTAIAFEEGLTYEDELFSDAPYVISSVDTINCWRQNEGGNHGIETLRQAFENSCNPIFVQLAKRIGIDKYYQYVHNFGFFNVTGIDLPAEGVGIFHKNPSIVDLATLSFGESSTVTPLQLANAYCALVNGGTLMTPHIAKELTDQNGNVVKEFNPQVIRTIFSEKTADRIKALMKDVVTEGTGSAGYVEGYNVAGKTSTSTIETGTYAGLHVLSFGCYAPSDNPQIVVLMVINMPADKTVGSSSATKAAAGIVSKTLEYMNVKHEYTDSDYVKLATKYSVPDVTDMTYKEAKKKLYTSGFTFAAGEDTMTDDTIITASFPAKDETLYKNGLVVLYSSATISAQADDGTNPQTDNTQGMKKVMIPDFSGKDISECIREARISGVNLNIQGNIRGTAISQTPPPSFGDPAVTPTPTGGSTPTETPTETPAETPTETPTESPTAVPTAIPTPTPAQVPMGTIITITME